MLVETEKVKYKAIELVNKLKEEKNVIAKGNLKKLQELARNNSLPIEYEKPVVKEGWVGKSKGMLQILYERGFLNPQLINSYTINGSKDEYGAVIPGTSLKEMMNSLEDFCEEETLLQHHGRLLNVIVDRTPKCHPEIAGEGVEYSWAAAKINYRRLRITEKRTKQKFRDSVNKCTDRDNVLTIRRQRLFSKRARQYMLAYRAIDLKRDEERDAAEEGDEMKMSHSLLEKVLKAFKTHRCTADIDTKWIADVVASMNSQIVIN